MKEMLDKIMSRLDAIEARFEGSEGDYDKNQRGMTSEPNKMEVHQPSTKESDPKKKKMNMMIALLKKKNSKRY